LIEGRIFLTGASGYVGRHLLEALLRHHSCRVVALAREPGRLPVTPRDAPDLEVVQGGLGEPATYAEALRGCTGVVHLAATTGKARKRAHRRTNVEGTRQLLIAAKQACVAGFLHVSTIAAAFPDKTGYHYARTKEQAEQLVAQAGLPYTILRPTMVFGPGAPVLAGLRKLADAPFGPIAFGSGTVRVQPVFVQDLVDVILAVLDAPRFQGETIEVGGPETMTIEELLLRLRGRGVPDGTRRARHLPLRPIRALLRLLEAPLLPFLPLTAGQLATFANDGTAAPHPFTARRRRSLRDLDAMTAHEAPDA